MSTQTAPRSEAELNETIAVTRAELTDTLQALTYELQPKVQLGLAKESATREIEKLKAEAAETFRGVLQGDRDSIILAAKVAGVTAAGLALLVVRAKRRRIRRTEVRQWRLLVRQLKKITPPANLRISIE